MKKLRGSLSEKLSDVSPVVTGATSGLGKHWFCRHPVQTRPLIRSIESYLIAPLATIFALSTQVVSLDHHHLRQFGFSATVMGQNRLHRCRLQLR
jgi:hypothetical protein